MFRGLLSATLLVALQTTAFAQQPCTTDANHVVDELYRHILERAADAGSSGWVADLQKGTTVREVVRQLASSPEHQQRFYNPADGALANQRAVDTLYRHILGRQPDAAGEKSYTAMAASKGIGTVVNSIVASPEYNQNFGDWGVPGSGGLVYCGPGGAARAQAGQTPTATRGVAPAPPAAPNNSGNSGSNSGNYGGGGRDGGNYGGNYGGGNNNGGGNAYGGDPRDGGGNAYSGANGGGYSDRGGDRDRGDRRGSPYNPYDDYRMSNNDRFNYLDVNHDGVIERNEWDGSLDQFYRLDRNNDGRLTRAELGAVQASSSFRMLDTNRDGRISLGEWPYSHRSFDQMDVNGDGVITPDEFQPGPPPPPRGR